MGPLFFILGFSDKFPVFEGSSRFLVNDGISYVFMVECACFFFGNYILIVGVVDCCEAVDKMWVASGIVPM
eukprot:14117437-Ditylum_brightwellii.AAC.1